MKTINNIIKLAIITICVLWTAAIGAPVKFAWDAAPVVEKVTITHLREKLPDGSTVFLVESKTQTATVELSRGSHIIVATAQNQAGWSQFSDELVVMVEDTPPVIPKPIEITRYFIQSSIDLTKWKDEFEVFPEQEKKFWRIKIVTP